MKTEEMYSSSRQLEQLNEVILSEKICFIVKTAAYPSKYYDKTASISVLNDGTIVVVQFMKVVAVALSICKSKSMSSLLIAGYLEIVVEIETWIMNCAATSEKIN